MAKPEYLKQIQSAKSEKNYDLMLAKAKEAMGAFPSDEDFQELLHDAQGYYVNQKLDSELLRTLELKEDWQGLQAVYLKLLSVFPESKKLHKLLEKVRKQVEKTSARAKVDFYKKAEVQIRDMIQKGELHDAESACYEILGSDPSQTHILALLAKVQHRIDKEIESALSLYYETSMPALKKEYAAHKEDYIRV